MTSDQAILRTTLAAGARRGCAAPRSTPAPSDVGLFEIARVYLPAGEQLPDERWRLGGVVQGGYAAAKGVARDALRRAPRSSSRVERGSHPLLHPGQGRGDRGRVVGELHPTLLEGAWGAFELDLDTLFDAVPERIVYEDVITYPAVQPGHRGRRRRGRRGRRARRRRARGRRPAAPRGARLRRLPRRAGRRGAEVGRDPPLVPVPRADAHRRGGGASPRRGSSRRSPSASAPSSARSRQSDGASPRTHVR